MGQEYLECTIYIDVSEDVGSTTPVSSNRDNRVAPLKAATTSSPDRQTNN